MSNVTTGDLAIVVAPFVVEGRGAFVRVKAYDGRAWTPSGGYGDCWLCEGWVRFSGDFLRGPEVSISDHCLRRIDPPADPDTLAEPIDAGELAHA